MDAARFAVIAVFAVVVVASQDGLPIPEALAAGDAAPPANAATLLTLLCLAALLIGFAEVVHDNSAQTLIPSVVAKNQLERANGRLWGAETIMNSFVGPPLSGLLLGIAVALPFFVNAGLLAVAAALIFALAGTFTPRGGVAPGKIAWRAEIGEGFGWLWNHRLLRALAVLLGSMNLLGAMTFAIMVLYAQEILGLFEGWQYGAVLTGTAIGAVVGSLVAPRVSERLSAGTSLLVVMVGMGVGFFVIAFVSSATAVWLAGVTTGVMIMLWNVITVSLRQRIIPDHLLGRVNSVYRFFGWGTISLGTLLGGVLVTLGEPVLGREWALRAPFLIAGTVSLALLAYAAPNINTARIEAAEVAAIESQM
jgi:MFS family permease